jgi:single-stranded DNA-binding protein
MKQFKNDIIIAGPVGQCHVTAVAGTETAQFSVMTEDTYSSRDGSTVVNCTWFSVRAAGLADLSKITKGSWVEVHGKQRCRRYVGGDGVERVSYEIIAHTVKLVEE